SINGNVDVVKTETNGTVNSEENETHESRTKDAKKNIQTVPSETPKEPETEQTKDEVEELVESKPNELEEPQTENDLTLDETPKESSEEPTEDIEKETTKPKTEQTKEEVEQLVESKQYEKEEPQSGSGFTSTIPNKNINNREQTIPDLSKETFKKKNIADPIFLKRERAFCSHPNLEQNVISDNKNLKKDDYKAIVDDITYEPFRAYDRKYWKLGKTHDDRISELQLSINYLLNKLRKMISFCNYQLKNVDVQSSSGNESNTIQRTQLSNELRAEKLAETLVEGRYGY
ncbi:hypothetical protein SNEBB_006240, partial [Seison nebaliae]